MLSSPVTPERYAAARHVVVSRKGSFTGPVDDALKARGLQREIVTVVPGFPDALRIARQSDLVALVPRSCLGDEVSIEGLAAFELPVTTPGIGVSALWHPRMDADPAHRWLRETVIAVRQARLGPDKFMDLSGFREQRLSRLTGAAIEGGGTL